MCRAFLSLCLGLSLTGLVVASESPVHRLEPAQVGLGERTDYIVVHPATQSVEALSLTTVHPPAGEGIELLETWTEVRGDLEAWVRVDGFRLRPHTPGKISLKPAVVEVRGVLGVANSLILQVDGKKEVLPTPAWSLGLGLCLVLPALFLWFRPGAEVDTAEDIAGQPEAQVDPLAACREARIRGDARGFYVSLFAALRGQVRAATGRSPRDPAGLARTARDAGVSAKVAENLRDLAARCERVVFGGEAADVASIQEAYDRSAAILEALNANQANSKESES